MPTIDSKKRFGNSVRAWRTQRGISQEKLAERADLHRTYISDVERGARNISLESMSKLARALEISVASLFPSESRIGKSGSGNGHGNLIEILLVEDNSDDVELTLHAFKQARFANHVQVFRDGAAVLDHLFQNAKNSRRRAMVNPCVVLLDLKLPKVSGLEVLRRIREDERTARIPVVILTASDDQRDIAQCRRLGADNYIAKPVNLQRLSQATPRLNLDWALLKPPEHDVRDIKA